MISEENKDKDIIIKDARKKNIRKIANKILVINKKEDVDTDEIKNVSYSKAKKLIHIKSERSAKQKANDERLRDMQKKKHEKPPVEIEKENKKTVKIRVLPKRINKKKLIKIEEEEEENNTSSDSDETLILKKRVKKISKKKELYDTITHIKENLQQPKMNTNNQYDHIINAMFRVR